jgi:outer membrane protein assembly factor BamB
VGPTGTVFVATWIRRTGSRESLISLSARRPADGTRRWHATYGRGAYGVDPGPLGVSPDGSTLVLGASVYAASSDGCPRAAGAAFDTSTGAERWHALGPVIPGCGQVFDVDVTGRVAIFTRYGTYGAHGGETYDVTVVTAREISDGSLRWRRSFRYLFLGKTEIGPNGRRAIVAGEWQGRVGQGLVLSLEVATGATLWRRGLPMDVWAATFAPSATRVYVTGEAYPADLESTRGVVRALDAEDGAGRWRASYRDPELPNAGWVDVSCSPRGSAVFVIGDSNDGTPGWASGIVGHVLVASYRA